MVGGDGIFHEMINGLMRNPNKAVQQIPIGYIPGGSGNALAKNLDTPYVEHAIVNVIKMYVQPLDLFSYRYLSHGVDDVKYGFLEVMWTLIADIDIESERIRWAGNLRFTLWAILRVIAMRRYSGTLYYTTSGEHVGDLGDLSQFEARGWQRVQSTAFNYWMAMNLPWAATDFLVAPDCTMASGSLDLYWMADASRADILRLLLDTESGKYV